MEEHDESPLMGQGARAVLGFCRCLASIDFVVHEEQNARLGRERVREISVEAA